MSNIPSRPDLLLNSELNLMGEFSDIIDGYLRIENVDLLNKSGIIDRLNEFSVFCECRSLGDRWTKTEEIKAFSLIVTQSREFYVTSKGNPWEGNYPSVSITGAVIDFGVAIVDKSSIGLVVFTDGY